MWAFVVIPSANWRAPKTTSSTIIAGQRRFHSASRYPTFTTHQTRRVVATPRTLLVLSSTSPTDAGDDHLQGAPSSPPDQDETQRERAAILRALDADLEGLIAAEQEKRSEEERMRQEAERRAEERRINPPTNRRFFVAFDLPEAACAHISQVRRQARHDWEQGELDYLLAREQKNGLELKRDARGGRLLTWVREPVHAQWRTVLNYVGMTNHDAIEPIREALEKAVLKVPMFQVAVSKNVVSYYPGSATRTRNFNVAIKSADGSRMLDNLALVVKNELDVLKSSKLGKSLGLRLKMPPKLRGDADERRKSRMRISKLPSEYQEGFSSTVTLAHVDYYANTSERVRCFKSIKPDKHPQYDESLIFTLDKITLFEQIIEDGNAPIYNALTTVTLPTQKLPEVTVLREHDETTRLLDDPYSQSTEVEDELSRIVEIHDEPNEMEDVLFYRNRLHVNLRIQGDPKR